jgi:hypothetical protein
MLVLVQKMQVRISVHRETIGLMLTNFRVGDRVEDKKLTNAVALPLSTASLNLKARLQARQRG